MRDRLASMTAVVDVKKLERQSMNLELLAAFRGEIWANRVLRRRSVAGVGVSDGPWPGTMAEARKLATALGRPRLVEALAAIILERASVAWDLSVQS